MCSRYLPYTHCKHRSLENFWRVQGPTAAPERQVRVALVYPLVWLPTAIFISNRERRQRLQILSVGVALFGKVCVAFAAPNCGRLKMPCLDTETWGLMNMFVQRLRRWCG